MAVKLLALISGFAMLNSAFAGFGLFGGGNSLIGGNIANTPTNVGGLLNNGGKDVSVISIGKNPTGGDSLLSVAPNSGTGGISVADIGSGTADSGGQHVSLLDIGGNPLPSASQNGTEEPRPANPAAGLTNGVGPLTSSGWVPAGTDFSGICAGKLMRLSTHGANVQVENSTWSITRTKYGGLVRPEIGLLTEWVHFAIPTPTYYNGVRQRVRSAHLYYRMGKNAAITGFDYHDGDTSRMKNRGLNLRAHNDSKLIAEYYVPDQPYPKWGSSISVEISFDGNGTDAYVGLVSAGIDYIGALPGSENCGYLTPTDPSGGCNIGNALPGSNVSQFCVGNGNNDVPGGGGGGSGTGNGTSPAPVPLGSINGTGNGTTVVPTGGGNGTGNGTNTLPNPIPIPAPGIGGNGTIVTPGGGGNGTGNGTNIISNPGPGNGSNGTGNGTIVRPGGGGNGTNIIPSPNPNPGPGNGGNGTGNGTIVRPGGGGNGTNIIPSPNPGPGNGGNGTGNGTIVRPGGGGNGTNIIPSPNPGPGNGGNGTGNGTIVSPGGGGNGTNIIPSPNPGPGNGGNGTGNGTIVSPGGGGNGTNIIPSPNPGPGSGGNGTGNGTIVSPGGGGNGTNIIPRPNPNPSPGNGGNGTGNGTIVSPGGGGNGTNIIPRPNPNPSPGNGGNGTGNGTVVRPGGGGNGTNIISNPIPSPGPGNGGNGTENGTVVPARPAAPVISESGDIDCSLAVNNHGDGPGAFCIPGKVKITYRTDDQRDKYMEKILLMWRNAIWGHKVSRLGRKIVAVEGGPPTRTISYTVTGTSEARIDRASAKQIFLSTLSDAHIAYIEYVSAW